MEDEEREDVETHALATEPAEDEATATAAEDDDVELHKYC